MRRRKLVRTVREVKGSDYEGLTTLYMQLRDDLFSENQTVGVDLWRGILTDERHHIIMTKEGRKIASPCVYVVILDPVHTRRPCTLIENVITGSGYRKKELATVCLHYAEETAVNENYYKIMLPAGVEMESTLNLYEQAGYNRNDKTAFI